MDFEQMAVAEVIQNLSKTDNLKAFIEMNGTTPSFDGFIQICKDETYSKKEMKCVNVQVKGMGVESIPQNPSFPVSVIDIENYKNNGGTIFFVVFIDKIQRVVLGVYYNSILPYYAKEVLSKNRNKTTINLSLKSFPSENDDIVELILNFYSNSQKQSCFANVEIPSIEELMKSGDIENFTFSYTPVGKTREEAVIPYFMEGKELYLYAKTKSNPIPIPIQHIDVLDEIFSTNQETADITVNGECFYNSYKLTQKRKSMIIKIGNSFILEFGKPKSIKDKTVKLNFSYKIKGTLNERINDLRFIISVIENEGFYISKTSFPMKKEVFYNANISLEKLNGILDEYMLVQKTLEKLQVKKDLNMDDFSEEDCRRINLLVRAFEYNEPITSFKDTPPTISLFRISNIVLLLLFEETPNGIVVHNFFNKTLDVYINDENDNKIELSQYYILKKESFKECNNICYQSIVDDFKSKNKSEALLTEANELLLKMLDAYDETKNDELYDCIKEISQWICENSEDFFDSDIAKVNHFQILKRKRSLLIEEKEALFDIYKQTDFLQLKIGCLLLIDDKENAISLLEKLPAEEKKAFMTFPIWKFSN